MQKLHFSIIINASPKKVWQTMLSDSTYRQWTEAFSSGSHFVGSWDEGTEIKFLGPNEQGVMEGMLSRIKESRPYEYISIEHLGEIKDGKVDTSSEKVKKWAGALENYTFKAINGGTEVLIDTDTEEEYKEIFEKMWPKALQKLKEIVETESITVTVETIIHAPIEKVWKSWTEPNHIVNWAFAMDTWEAPHAENDLRTGGKFNTVMAAKDGSVKFNFNGVYTDIKEFELIEYDMEGGRHVKVQFTQLPDGVKLSETFEIENLNPKEMQQGGWQAILDNFKKYTESNL